MSMCMYVKRGSEIELQRLARSPDDLAHLAMAHWQASMPGVGGAVDPAALDRLGAGRRVGLGGRLLLWFIKRQLRKQARAMPAPVAAAKTAPEGEPPLDLHKSWHVLHYLFTGEAWGGRPPANALMAGREVGEDLGYGPARILTPAEAGEFAGFLAGTSVNQLTRGLDVPRMAALEIYTADDDASAGEIEDDIAHYFPKLKDYVTAAAGQRQGLMIWMM